MSEDKKTFVEWMYQAIKKRVEHIVSFVIVSLWAAGVIAVFEYTPEPFKLPSMMIAMSTMPVAILVIWLHGEYQNWKKENL